MIDSNMSATSHIKVIPARITSGKNAKSETNNEINKLVFVNDRFSSMESENEQETSAGSPLAGTKGLEASPRTAQVSLSNSRLKKEQYLCRGASICFHT